MKTININGRDYTIEQLSKILTQADNPMIEVYEFNGTTEQQFEEMYKNIPAHIKAVVQEEMVVNFYNKGEKVNWNNKNQKKYYPWFYLGNNFCFGDVRCCYHYSGVSSRLCYLREKDCMEAVEKFIHIYNNSRNN